jgi:Fe-S-cluster containining protein
MVADKRKILRQVAEIYDWLDEQLHSNLEQAGRCEACGKCCDFEAFGHRLFITSPELIYLAENLAGESLLQMQTSRCPYNQSGKCTIYEYRFTGCRIFCCRGDADFQSRLSETAISRLKTICVEFDIPYLYMPLNIALDGQRHY